MTLTFGEEMADLAQELTEEFSAEIGLSTLKHLTGSAYNTDTGTYAPTYSTQSAYMVFDGIQAEEVQNVAYRAEHEQCTVAGDDLTVAPVRDDLIVKPDATSHRVVHVITDQYAAAYVLHIERKNT